MIGDRLPRLVLAGKPDVADAGKGRGDGLLRRQAAVAVDLAEPRAQVRELVVVQLQAEDPVLRGTLADHVRQIGQRRRVAVAPPGPQRALPLLFLDVEPLPGMAGDAGGAQPLAEQPAARAGLVQITYDALAAMADPLARVPASGHRPALALPIWFVRYAGRPAARLIQPARQAFRRAVLAAPSRAANVTVR